jgi:RecB family exonuclease
MDETLIVLPSARAIRQRQLEVEEETLFLPNYITMSEFISKISLVSGERFMDNDTRTLLLLEASNFKNFSNLQIERNFFTFTKNSSYIFKFFEELSAELYDIKALKNADFYAEYEEHITILEELYYRYEQLTIEKNLIDTIFLPKRYRLNSAYLKKYKEIIIQAAGYLTNFELQLLEEATQYCRITVEFETSRFNTKMQKKLQKIGFDIQPNRAYKLNLNTKTTKQFAIEDRKTAVQCVSFSEPLLEVAFIKQKIYEFIRKGYSAEKIAVILPNEKRAELIRSFDIKANLNFAMGRNFQESSIYKKMNAAKMLLDDKSYENIYRLKRDGETLYMLLSPIYKKSMKELDFIALMQEFASEITDKAELAIFQEELHSFSKILPFVLDMNFRLVFTLFMQRLASRTLDDIRGGKITVMGVLETRSVHFDAVIIIDFDEQNVPKRSNKDMFLNTALREIAGLPTMQERENLQKHYYEMLIRHSQEVAICYVDSAQVGASRFLKELAIKVKSSDNELAFANILLKQNKKLQPQIKEIVEAYSFKDIELSASRLKTFLSCKRRYYYRYVAHIKEHVIPQDMPKEYEIGNVVHKALENLYRKRTFYDDAKLLEKDLQKELQELQGRSEFESYLIALKKRELRAFVANEIKRFAEGWQVRHVEKSFKVPYRGIVLQGKIDRVDTKENLVSVLDYKTGSYNLYTKKSVTEATDFQLEFYYLLAGAEGNVSECAFYDLKEGVTVPEAFLEEKLALLNAHIEDLLNIEEVNFALCEDIKQCQFCPYSLMCGRG